jgi:hypothetical protein
MAAVGLTQSESGVEGWRQVVVDDLSISFLASRLPPGLRSAGSQVTTSRANSWINREPGPQCHKPADWWGLRHDFLWGRLARVNTHT